MTACIQYYLYASHIRYQQLVEVVVGEDDSESLLLHHHHRLHSGLPCMGGDLGNSILDRHHHHHRAHNVLHSQIQRDTAHAGLNHILPRYMF